MRVPNSQHEDYPWRVHGLIEDFKLMDVWRFPVEASGDPATDFATFRALFEGGLSAAAEGGSSGASAWLFKLRLAMGRWFGWDKVVARPLPDGSVSLRARLPLEERQEQAWFAAEGDALADAFDGFRPVYEAELECLLEISNSTVHAGIHLGWRQRPDSSSYTADMAVYALARGISGRLYLGLIWPFRHFIVYPSLMRGMRRRWDARAQVSGR